MLTNAYLSFFHDLNFCFLSGFYSLTIRHPVGVVCFLLSRKLTFVLILPFCQRDNHHRANANDSNINNDSGEDDDDDKSKDKEDDDDDSRAKPTTTMPHPRRPLGKAAKRVLRRAEEEAKWATTTINEGLPPPSAQSTPKSAGGKRKTTTTVPGLVVTATSTSRAVTPGMAGKRKRQKKEEDGTVILPSGVVISWEPEGVSVAVGEPYEAPPRRNPREVVDRGVGPTRGCGPWKEGDGNSIFAVTKDPGSTPTTPATPKRKKPSRSGRAETAPDPDAPTAPARSIEQPAPSFVNTNDLLPQFPPSRREIKR